MIRRKDYLEDLAKAKLAKSAYELGLEVGEHGHIETVGWVNQELKHMIQQAEDLSMAEIVRKRYEFGKEKGRLRREGKYSQISSGGKVKTGLGKELSAHAIARRASEDRFVERISSEEGILSTIEIMRVARGDPDIQAHLSNLLAGVVDLHDRIMEMPPGRSPDSTFDSALQMITEVGWLTTYEVKFFDERSTMANIETTSILARSLGESETPVCQPICNVLETIGLKTFGKHVLAVEESCMAQGKPHCTFKMFPREVPKEVGI
jgi:hypothetical protein